MLVRATGIVAPRYVPLVGSSRSCGPAWPVAGRCRSTGRSRLSSRPGSSCGWSIPWSPRSAAPDRSGGPFAIGHEAVAEVVAVRSDVHHAGAGRSSRRRGIRGLDGRGTLLVAEGA